MKKWISKPSGHKNTSSIGVFLGRKKRTVIIRVIKFPSDIENMYTYFELVPCDYWNDFDSLRETLVSNLGYKVTSSLDGIWSRHSDFTNGYFSFRLYFHDDFGNCLCHPEKQDNIFYDRLEEVANNLAEEYNSDRCLLRKKVPFYKKFLKRR